LSLPGLPSDRLRALAERALLDTTTDGVAVVDRDGNVAFANGRLAQMIRVAASELPGRAAVDLVAPEGREEMKTALGRATAGAVVQLRAPSGRGRGTWVQLATSPLTDEAGRYAGAFCSMTDVSEWRRSEQALRTVADVSRALAGTVDFAAVAGTIARSVDGGVLVGLLETEGTTTIRATATVDGTVEGQLAGLVGRVVPLVPGMVVEEVVRTGEALLLGAEAPSRIQPLFHKIAADMALGSLAVVPLHVHGKVIGAMCLFRGARVEPFRPGDLPLLREIADRAAMAFERARLFEEQRRSNERLRMLADAGTLLAQSLEVGPTIAALARFLVRQSFADLCAVRLFEDKSVTLHEIATRDPALLQLAHRALEPFRRSSELSEPTRRMLESGVPALVRQVDDTVLRRLAVEEAQVDALRALGLRSLVAVPLFARGKPLGLVSLARTGGAPYDEDDVAVARELGSRAALAIDNARLFRSATEAIALRDEFLSIASHELNTPLTPLKMQLDSLRRGRFPAGRVAEKLDSASRQVTRLTRLVSELLDVSRIRSGRLDLEPEPFDLAALLEEVAARLRDEAEQAGVTITVRTDGPCIGSWDRMRIDQVVTNLMTNAIKYGGGKPVDIVLADTGDGVRISVRDHGIGIAPEHQRRIFERFERAASPRYYGGFGLGLWIARQIVEASGGTIAVESAPDEGATFVVRLPRAAS
jgi:PAS domain S-box-containing protein